MVLVRNLPNTTPYFIKGQIIRHIGTRILEVKLDHGNRRVHRDQIKILRDQEINSEYHETECWCDNQASNTPLQDQRPVIIRSNRERRPPRHFDCERYDKETATDIQNIIDGFGFI